MDLKSNTWDQHLNGKGATEKAAPVVFHYLDYRSFLSDAFHAKKARNPNYSEAAFLRDAGFSSTSRGYLALILSGRRNLSSKTAYNFCRALKLNMSETEFFENLVRFNQSKTQAEKDHYLAKLRSSRGGKKIEAIELLQSQLNYLSNWHLVAVRELVGTAHFREDPVWIAQRLKKRVSPSQVSQAISDLLKLGVLKRDENGCLVQTNEVVRFVDSGANYFKTSKISQQLIQLAIDELHKTEYQKRSLSSVVMAANSNDFQAIRERIKQFRSELLERFSRGKSEADLVICVGLQLFGLSELSEQKVKMEGNEYV